MPVAAHPWHQAAFEELLRRRQTLPHALLFKGRKGIGKLDFVRKLAQSIACAAPATSGAACETCQSCRWFAAGAHPDYREIQPEAMRPEAAVDAGERKPSQYITIDDVRGLADFINLTAHGAAGKTIVFYPAEALNFNAANALLKNLEEPPAGTRFMLVSHRPSALPATIISRCQQLALATPSIHACEKWLREQGVADAALALAQTANAPLAALDLDQDEYWPQRKALLSALSNAPLDVLAISEQAARYPTARLLGWLQRWSYDLLSAKSTGQVRYNPDFAVSIARVAVGLRAIDIAHHHRMLVHEQRHVNHPLNPRLHLESLLFAYQSLVRGDSQGAESRSIAVIGHAG